MYNVIKGKENNSQIKKYQPLLIGEEEEEHIENKEKTLITSKISDENIMRIYKSLFLTAKEKANSIIRDAEKEANKILDKVNSEVESIREKTYNEAYKHGYDKGYKVGYNEGKKEGEKMGYENTIKEAKPIFSTLANMIKQVQKIRKKTYIEANTNIIKLALLIAETILYTKLQLDSSSLIKIIDSILQKTASKNKIIIRLHPEDLKYIQETKDALIKKYDLSTLILTEDPSIHRGGCIIKSDLGEADARIDIMFEEVKGAILKILEGSLSNHSDKNTLENEKLIESQFYSH